MDRWTGVCKAARQLSSIPLGQGGPLSIAVASLASALKVSLLCVGMPPHSDAAFTLHFRLVQNMLLGVMCTAPMADYTHGNC